MILLRLTFNRNKIREDKMKTSLAKRSLVLSTLLAVVYMVNISYAVDTSKTQTVVEQGVALNQHENTTGEEMQCAKVPEPNGLTVATSSIIAGNYDVNKSRRTTASSSKGRDGAACSSNDECIGVCEGGSCCTDHDVPCDSTSHCCGHQSCTNGNCP
jgi:hypothetical protein